MRLFLILILTLVSIYCKGQNLVNNPSFEDTIPDNSYPGPPQLRPYFWFRPTEGSSDFFNSISAPLSGYGGGMPNNAFGYQFPRSGDAYLGFGVWVGPPSVNSREYIEGIMTDSLIQNHKYCLDFYVCSSNTFLFNSDDIGAYFSADSLKNDTSNLVLNVTPQIENIQGNILSDTLNWMLVSGSFIAQGGEKYITIGNFKDDSHTTLDTNLGGFYNGSYYYIDDVSLSDCTVGVYEPKSIAFSIKPNPVENNLIIQFENFPQNNLVLKISDILGNTVLKEDYLGITKLNSVNVSKLKTGIYFLSLANENEIIVRKFIKL